MTWTSSWAPRALVAPAAAATLLFAGAVAATAAPATGGDPAMAAQDAAGNGWSAVGYFYTALSTGDAGLMADAVDQDWTDVPSHPGLGTGVAGAEQLVGEIRSVFPDLTENITAVSRGGDRVHVSLLHCGTHSAEFAGVPATYKYVCFRGEETHTITHGLISTTEHWEDIDQFRKEVGA